MNDLFRQIRQTKMFISPSLFLSVFFNKNYLHECSVKFGTIKVSTEEVENVKKINELL